jgi:hypothetical protein
MLREREASRTSPFPDPGNQHRRNALLNSTVANKSVGSGLTERYLAAILSSTILLATDLLDKMAELTQANGNWVKGEDRFWNREQEIELFIERLDEGANLYLIAQRRIGKTSLMREVENRIDDDYICLQLDLQKAKTPEDVIVELSVATHEYASLWTKTRETFSNILSGTTESLQALQLDQLRVEIKDGLLGGNWPTKGNRLLTELADSEKQVVIFMDELPILLNRILGPPDEERDGQSVEMVDELMSWIRKNAIEHRGDIRFVIAGSIGLEPILRRIGLSATINNFKPINLKPWDADTAIGCLEALANNYDVEFEEGACERITERLACCIPHHVQMFFSHIYERCRKRGDMTCTVEDVDQVYEEHMLSTKGHAELSTFEERLEMMVGNDLLPFVLDLLTEAAVANGLTHDAIDVHREEHELSGREGTEKTREVLQILEHDGYLRRESEQYVFISHLLRDWWKRRFGGFGFTPASDRQ